MKHFDSRLQIGRPLRSAVRGACALFALVALAAPFADVPSRWLFLAANLGYSAFLSFTAVGVCILPPRTRARILRSMFFVQTLCVLISAAIAGFCYYFHRVPPLPTKSLVSALCLLLVLLAALAARGWYLHIFYESNRNT